MEELKISDELKKMSRRLDSIQGTVDLLFKDRDMLEDLVNRVSQLEHALNMNREHQTDVSRDIQNEVKKIELAVEDKIDEVRMSVEDKTIIVKSSSESIFNKLKKRLGVK